MVEAQPMKILLYGPPGAGKDTVADSLSRILRIPALSTGDLIREEVEKQSEIGLQIAPYVLRGEIPPGNIGTLLLRERLVRDDCKAGYILSGYPRSIEAIEKYLTFDRPTHVIHLLLDDTSAHDRLLARGRADDSEMLISKRIQRYEDLEIPACESWKEYPDVLYGEIFATGSREEVFRSIVDFLKLANM